MTFFLKSTWLTPSTNNTALLFTGNKNVFEKFVLQASPTHVRRAEYEEHLPICLSGKSRNFMK
jgi:hypothetical protein